MPDSDNVPELFTRSVRAMAMPFAIVALRDPKNDALDSALEAAADAVHSDLMWADEVFSLWNEDSPVSRLARGEITLTDCPPSVSEVFDECERYFDATGGAFNAKRGDGVIDPTGIVKTWAVARTTWRLEQTGTHGWMIGASGDAIAGGIGPQEMAWRVGIADPNVPAAQRVESIDVVELAGEQRAVCTSGTAEHGQHIWNTEGDMDAHYAQVSVVGSDFVAADAWATAIVAGGADTALAAQKAGFEVLCIDANQGDGELRASSSPGWPGLA